MTRLVRRTAGACLSVSLVAIALAATAGAGEIQYKLLATNKTSTLEKELNEAGDGGYRMAGVMGGESSFGGSEVVAVVRRDATSANVKRSYKLLATSKTSTMQKEMQEAADAGFEYLDQTVFTSAFGGDEVVVIMERAVPGPAVRHTYLLLATKKTSTMEKELAEAGADGYEFLGVTVSKTKFAGNEVVSILRKPVGGESGK